MNDTELTQEAEVLTSGGVKIEIKHESKHIHVELKIPRFGEGDQLGVEDLLSQIRAAFKTPLRGSYRWENLDIKLYLMCKLFAYIKSTFLAFEVEQGMIDATRLADLSRLLNECICDFLPKLAFASDAYRSMIESMLEGIREDNESESEPCQVDLLPIVPAQPVFQGDSGSTGTLVKPSQKAGNDQIGKSRQSASGIGPGLRAKLDALIQKKQVAEVNVIAGFVPSKP